MRLADFIATHLDVILAEWVAFAATRGPAAASMDQIALRDHAAAMLTDIVADLRMPQTPAERTARSHGDAESHGTRPDAAAENHGAERAASGFTLDAMVAEYRALRASVIRLWTRANGGLTGGDVEDLLRFDEAIDQALAAAITRYAHDLEGSRDVFLAILSHDLRTPLAAVLTSSQVLLEVGDLDESERTLATGIVSSARRMTAMVGDLMDFAHTWLGSSMPIVRRDMDLADAVGRAVDEAAAAYPDRVLQWTSAGDLRGAWDRARLGQLLANLLGNAVQYGAAERPVRVTAEGERTEIVLRVHNDGVPIPGSALPGLFSPRERLGVGEARVPASKNLGLGLYIAERIVTAHDGSISVTSLADVGTTFTVRLPR